MGCFSWIYSDIKKPLLIGEPGILVLPQSGMLVESVYEGYGMFAGQDVYELVAEWNRSYLAEHPEHELCGSGKKVMQCFWYPVYTDLSVPLNEVAWRLREKEKWLPTCYELREIGIAIACEDEDNQRLLYPIKICRYRENAEYEKLLPSIRDPGQGL